MQNLFFKQSKGSYHRKFTLKTLKPSPKIQLWMSADLLREDSFSLSSNAFLLLKHNFWMNQKGIKEKELPAAPDAQFWHKAHLLWMR